MNSRKYLQIFGLVLTGLVLFAGTSFARDGHDRRDDRRDDRRSDRHDRRHYYRYNDYPRYGLRVNIIPSSHVSISLGGLRFYYSDGLYYRRYGTYYEVVNPPYGAVVRRIPTVYRPVVVGGVTYYTDNGVYYVYTPGGYQVVPAPVTVLQAPPLVAGPTVVTTTPATVVATTTAATAPVTLGNDDTYTVNIPNEKAGGYTEVTLKRTEKGFVGPQGEFYAEFPRVSQLKAMYGK